MKIARIETDGKIGYAAVHEGPGGAVDFERIDGDLFGVWTLTGRRVRGGDARLLAPVCPPQIIAIGLNYKAHAEETGAKFPTAPVVFLKGVNALNDPGRPIVLPRMAPDEVDYEAELVIVIGKRARHVAPEHAHDYILGYTCGNDVSARDCQHRLDRQWARAKSFDTFAPLGPWIATGIDGDNLGVRMLVNGTEMQNGNTSDMIFSCRFLVSYLSHCMTLMPGMVIMTGTPAGVGFGRKPPVYLRPGDIATVEIESIGRLTNPIRLETIDAG